MKVTLVPSSISPPEHASNQYLTSLLINDTLAIDAGSLGFFGTPQQQAAVRHLVITHTHLDHIASLPVFVENAFEMGRDCVTVYGSALVLDCLRRDIFNDRVWPDFPKLSEESPNPLMRLAPLENGQTLELDGLRVTAVAVDHLVPTLGLIVEEPGAAVVFPSDTGPTEEIWRRANATPNLKAAFVEAAFPDELAWLADVAKHLTPARFDREVRKLAPSLALFALHIKPRYFRQIEQELLALGLPNLQICQPGKVYQF